MLLALRWQKWCGLSVFYNANDTHPLTTSDTNEKTNTNTSKNKNKANPITMRVLFLAPLMEYKATSWCKYVKKTDASLEIEQRFNSISSPNVFSHGWNACLSRVDKPASLIFSCSLDLLHHHAYTRPNIARARKSLSSGQKWFLEFCYRHWKCPFWK